MRRSWDSRTLAAFPHTLVCGSFEYYIIVHNFRCTKVRTPRTVLRKIVYDTRCGLVVSHSCELQFILFGNHQLPAQVFWCTISPWSYIVCPKMPSNVLLLVKVFWNSKYWIISIIFTIFSVKFLLIYSVIVENILVNMRIPERISTRNL